MVAVFLWAFMYQILKIALINFLRGAAVKLALKKLLGSAVMGGFRAWIVRFIIKELFDEVAEPLINLAVRKSLLVYDKKEGKLRIDKNDKAKREGNEPNYIDNISDA